MKIRLKPISHKRISDLVFDQLRDLIFRGEYKPGQKILTERELARALNVSRTSVREAINKLVTLRFLEHRQGQGTFVCAVDEAIKIPLDSVMQAQDASLVDLLEMRMGVECTDASLAAQRADTADLTAIEKAIGEMERDVAAGGLGTDGDLAFHLAIASATKNPLQVYIVKNIAEFLHMGIRESLMHLYKDPANIDEILKQHKAIFARISDKDAVAASDAMKKHIDFVIWFFQSQQIE
jgi:GntR family transcriptional regulator, transcriptional repressor for pyruvate dehydrogenase complex